MNNIPQYYCFYCVLDQTIGEHERLKKSAYKPQTFEWYCVSNVLIKISPCDIKLR